MSSGSDEEEVTRRRPTSRRTVRAAVEDDDDDDDDGDNVFDGNEEEEKDEDYDAGDDAVVHVSFSAKSLQKALIRLGGNLNPRLSFDETNMTTWDNVKKIIVQNGIKLDQVEELADNVALSSSSDEQLALEFKCLVSSVATNACHIYQQTKEPKLCQALFTAKKGTTDKTRFLANYVSNLWLQDSITALQSSSAVTIVESTNMHVHLLCSGMEFMESCFVIDTGKRLTNIKEKRDMDWQDLVDRIFKLSQERKWSLLHASAESTKKHLELLNSPPPPSTTSGGDDAAMGAAAAAPTTATLPVAVARKTSLQDVNARKREERLARMKSQAHGTSVRQVVVTPLESAVASPAAAPLAYSIPRAAVRTEPIPTSASSSTPHYSTKSDDPLSEVFTATPKDPPRSAWALAESNIPSSVMFAAQGIAPSTATSTSTTTTRPVPRPPHSQTTQRPQPSPHVPQAQTQDSAPQGQNQYNVPPPQGQSSTNGGVGSGSYSSSSHYEPRAATAPPNWRMENNRAGSSSSIDHVGGVGRGNVAWENSGSSRSNVATTSYDNQTDGGGHTAASAGPQGGYREGNSSYSSGRYNYGEYDSGSHIAGSYSSGGYTSAAPVAATTQDYSRRANDDEYYYSQQGSNPKRPSQAAADQNYSKRPRPTTTNSNNSDYYNNGPRATGQGPPPTSVDGTGRGRGRGSHLNMPAWMTTGSTTSGTNAADGPQGMGSGGSSSSNYALPPLNSSQFAAPPLQQQYVPEVGRGGGGIDDNRGRGRGSHKNVPAWMTNGSAGTIGAGPPPQTAAAAQGYDNHGGIGGQYPASRLPPPPIRMDPPVFTSNSGGSRGFADVAPPSAGRGRGRGVSNLPAWMTQERYGDDV